MAHVTNDFPPVSTLRGYFYAWRDEGLLDEINRELVAAARLAEGRKAQPTAGVIDSQRHIFELKIAGDRIYSELKNMIVWKKSNAGMGTFYRSQHELVFAYKVGTAPHINTFGFDNTGRYRTNVWEYAGVNSFGASQRDLEPHPTVKPVALVGLARR